MRIGAVGEVRPEGIELAEVEPWSRTIERLLLQFAVGEPDPVRTLPDDLRSPSGRAGGPPRPGPRPTGDGSANPVLDALLAWWRSGQANDPGLRKLKEHQLRSIVTTGSRTEAEVRRHLPTPLATYARRIAEVITRGTAPAAVPPPTTPPTTPPTAPPTPPPTVPQPSPRPTTPQPPTQPSAQPSPRPSSPPPGATPAAAPQPSAPAGATPDPDEELSGLRYADYEYLRDHPEPAPVRRRSTPTGTVLSWPEYSAEPDRATVLYRVVSLDDDWAPGTPQEADLLVVTEDLRCVDERPFTAPVRHVQVWVHAGRDRESAAATEPVLHASCVVVARVSDARVREDGRSVVGQWRVPSGVASVEVLRVPRERARRDGHSGPEYRLTPLRPFINGFVDDGAERGRRYVYEMSVEVEVEGVRHRSDPVKVEVAISAVLAPVTDLRIEDNPDDASVVDLVWTSPAAGDVRIFRSKQPPAAGVTERTLPVADLPAARLTDDADVARPVDVHPDGTSRMVGVPWLDGWTSAYLTPVTILGGRAVVGPSTHAYRLIAVEHAEIVERTHTQIVTFAWPDGADAVLAYLGGPQETADEAVRRGRPEEISRAQYVARGGMYFRTRLAPGGCSVHLVPVAHSAGERITGPATSLSYPGLLQMAYEVHTERDKAQRAVALRVWIRAEQDVPQQYVFALVHRPDRLPLHEHDGHPLPMTPQGDPRAVPGYHFRPSGVEARFARDVFWITSAEGLVGFVRLFVSLPAATRSTVALFDPPIDQLWIAPPQVRP
jgi:hypothetical protein